MMAPIAVPGAEAGGGMSRREPPNPAQQSLI